MSYIDDMRQRVELAEQRFGRINDQKRQITQHLLSLMDRIEAGLGERRADFERQAAEIERLTGENEELRGMLHQLLLSLESGDDDTMSDALGALDAKVAALIGAGATPATPIEEIPAAVPVYDSTPADEPVEPDMPTAADPTPIDPAPATALEAETADADMASGDELPGEDMSGDEAHFDAPFGSGTPDDAETVAMAAADEAASDQAAEPPPADPVAELDALIERSDSMNAEPAAAEPAAGAMHDDISDEDLLLTTPAKRSALFNGQPEAADDETADPLEIHDLIERVKGRSRNGGGTAAAE